MQACQWEAQDRLICRFRVQPRASREGLAGVVGDRLKLKVHAPPVDGAANAAVVRWAARAFSVSRAQVEIIRGLSARDKTLRIVSPCKIPDEIAAHIAPTGAA
ncbi:MAG: DUF167 family protein [Gammaproteobacteria bacterium]